MAGGPEELHAALDRGTQKRRGRQLDSRGLCRVHGSLSLRLYRSGTSWTFTKALRAASSSGGCGRNRNSRFIRRPDAFRLAETFRKATPNSTAEPLKPHEAVGSKVRGCW